MFASHIKNKKICIVDSNPKIAQKIKVSGGAKCNITNEKLSSKNYIGDKEFIQNTLNEFSNKDLLEFLNKNDVYPKVNPKIVKGTYFCNSSDEVITMFKKLLTTTKVFLNTSVVDLDFANNYKIKTNKNIIEAKKVVVASGGLSFESLGASSIAYDIASKFGHTIEKTKPALVGFTVQKDQFWFKNLSGISCEVQVKVDDKAFDGSLLFAHKGCSGPVILNTSLYWKKGKISIDFLSKNKIDKFLKGNKKISSAFPLPKRFMTEFLNSIKLEDKPVSSLTNEEKQKLFILKNYEFAPAGTFGFSKAEVTSGGINSDEINHKTFESLKQKGLYFLGECLDPTGELGGYNFQLYFSQAYKCAKEFDSK